MDGTGLLMERRFKAQAFSSFVIGPPTKGKVLGWPETFLFIGRLVFQIQDGIKWHDVGCANQKPVICQDNEELLKFVGL